MQTETSIQAQVLSSGSVLGPALKLDTSDKAVITQNIAEKDRPSEFTILEQALESAVSELKSLAKKLSAELGEDKAEILESHVDILSDDEFRDDLRVLVLNKGQSAAAAIQNLCEQHAQDMEELEDEYFRARAEDFRDIAQRVIRALRCPAGDKKADASTPFPLQPAIIVSTMLSPGQTISFHLPNVLGFVVSRGGTNTHAAILARSLGIPAFLVPETVVQKIHDGMELALDSSSALLVLEPEEKTRMAIKSSRETEQRHTEKLKQLRKLPAKTRCGMSIGLFANAGSMKDMPEITEVNADGIGLFRTEFLFMEEDCFPTAEKQAVYYQHVLDNMGDKAVIFRLLDIGADKPLPYAPHPKENNPFLGWRGIRWLLDNPAVLNTQIQAILMASAASKKTVRIMVPMISSALELRKVLELSTELQKRVGGKAHIGMMVETPAAALNIHSYKGLASFISIGSNDLTQYTLAADRENIKTAAVYNEFHPVILMLMKKACEDARGMGMETGICGEFASRPEAAVYLASMGFDELSMSARSIPGQKELIRALLLKDSTAVLEQALCMDSAEKTFLLAQSFVQSLGLDT